MDNKKGEKRSTFKKITQALSWALLVFLIAIGVFLVMYVVLSKIAQSKGEKPPMGLYTIISPSMTPKIKVYDVVFIRKIDPENIEVGDVITFYSTNSYFGGTSITHRVVEKYSTTEGLRFRTKGDANQTADSELVQDINILGKVMFKIPQLGRIQFFLATKGGWFVVILVPALAIISYDIYKLLKLLLLKNKMNEIKKNDDNFTNN